MQPEWVIGIAIAFSIFYTRKTGLSCGGIITPGLLALYAYDPVRSASALVLGAALVVPLSLVARALGLYGRERIGTAMLLALVARIGLSFIVPVGTHWVGWVIPGLIAADGERQGVGMTLCGSVACAVATVFGMTLLRRVTGL